MNAELDLAQVHRLLETDRGWCAYALADMDPAYAAHARWLVGDGAVVLLYSGLSPPVLFVHGDPAGAQRPLAQVPAGPIQFTLQGVHRAQLKGRLRADFEAKMWRMVLNPAQFPGRSAGECRQLTIQDLPAVEALMADHPDRPDAFVPEQLATGAFYGALVRGELVAMAGIHVLSEVMDVAALGNVFTRPDHRGRGLGRMVSAAATDSLLRRGLGTIVLNVAMANEPAVHLYRDLGFAPFCGYYEGVGELKPTDEESPQGRME